MKRNELFYMHDLADKHFIIPVGSATKNLHGVITVNDMGVEIWNLLESETTFEQVLEKILHEYDVDEAHAANDLNVFLDKLKELGAIEE